MQIKMNGEPLDVGDDATISCVLKQLDVQRKHVAVEVNQDVVPRERHETFQLNAGDRIEIVTLVGGG